MFTHIFTQFFTNVCTHVFTNVFTKCLGAAAGRPASVAMGGHIEKAGEACDSCECKGYADPGDGLVAVGTPLVALAGEKGGDLEESGEQ